MEWEYRVHDGVLYHRLVGTHSWSEANKATTTAYLLNKIDELTQSVELLMKAQEGG